MGQTTYFKRSERRQFLELNDPFQKGDLEKYYEFQRVILFRSNWYGNCLRFNSEKKKADKAKP
jgi:hypothetical protein